MKTRAVAAVRQGFFLFVVGVAWALSACASTSNALPTKDPANQAPLPEDIISLRALADKNLESSLPSSESLELADRALTKAVTMETAPSFESLWRLSKLRFHLANSAESKEASLKHATIGRSLAKQAQEHQPDRVESHYYCALNTALMAEARADKNLVAVMMEAGHRAAKLDPGFDNAGPLRFLGKVFITAPGWPTSVGSPEKGVATLERAVALSKSFLNRLFLAEACYHDEQYDRARALFQELQDDPNTRNEPARWREELHIYLELLRTDLDGAGDPEL